MVRCYQVWNRGAEFNRSASSSATPYQSQISTLEDYPGLSLPICFQPQNINLNEIPALLDKIDDSIGISRSLTELELLFCQNLSSLDNFLHLDYVPTIKRIRIMYCKGLISLPTARFHNFHCLEKLSVSECPILNWQRGLVLPSSLQTLTLAECGDYSACVPGCIENLKSLVSLNMSGWPGVTSILWLSNLASLKELDISWFPELVSIGGAEAVAKLKRFWIFMCPKFKREDRMVMR